MKETTSPEISEWSMTVERSRVRLGKEDIYVSMERLPDPDTYQYKVECLGCTNRCAYAFLYPRKLSFAFVGKFVGVFSSLCARLVKAEANKNNLVGQPNLIFDANNHSHDYDGEVK